MGSNTQVGLLVELAPGNALTGRSRSQMRGGRESPVPGEEIEVAGRSKGRETSLAIPKVVVRGDPERRRGVKLAP